MIKIINIVIAKISLGIPSTALIKLFNIVSRIYPLSNVKLIPRANPITIAIPIKSEAPFVNISIPFDSPFLIKNIRIIPNTKNGITK